MSTRDLPAASDEELVAAFVAGEQQAFDLLVQRYERRVYAICYRYFGNAADAEDAAQDAFVALLRRASTFKGTSTFATWMYRVATNACNDLARKRARRPQAADADAEQILERLPGGGGVEDELAARGLDEDLLAALRELDEPTREAVVLHDVYGVPYAEIAARADVAVGTVKSRIHRGHARLAAALEAAGSGAAVSRGSAGTAPGPAGPAGGSREPSRQPRPPTHEP